MGYPTPQEIKEAVAACQNADNGVEAIEKLILRTRIEEAEGFDHGNEAWSGNMNDDEVQSTSPIFNYQERLRKEMENLNV